VIHSNECDQLLHDLMNDLSGITAQCELMRVINQGNARTEKIHGAALKMANKIREHQKFARLSPEGISTT
jgi:hypothetical protein